MIEDDAIPAAPRKKDILFCNGFPDGHNNACLGFTYPGDYTGYTEGYRRGARLLVEHVNEHARDQDYLVYPIVFLYRHHIELAVKRLLRTAPYLVDRSQTESERKHLGMHRLDLLWQDLKPLLAGVAKAAGWDQLDKADIAGIDSYMRQLTELDRDSFSFRYASGKDGIPTLPEHLSSFNLRHFAELMERLADYLDSLDMAIDHLRDSKIEWEMIREQH